MWTTIPSHVGGKFAMQGRGTCPRFNARAFGWWVVVGPGGSAVGVVCGKGGQGGLRLLLGRLNAGCVWKEGLVGGGSDTLDVVCCVAWRLQ